MSKERKEICPMKWKSFCDNHCLRSDMCKIKDSAKEGGKYDR